MFKPCRVLGADVIYVIVDGADVVVIRLRKLV